MFPDEASRLMPSKLRLTMLLLILQAVTDVNAIPGPTLDTMVFPGRLLWVTPCRLIPDPFRLMSLFFIVSDLISAIPSGLAGLTLE